MRLKEFRLDALQLVKLGFVLAKAFENLSALGIEPRNVSGDHTLLPHGAFLGA
jgi:hypothetical protein